MTTDYLNPGADLFDPIESRMTDFVERAAASMEGLIATVLSQAHSASKQILALNKSVLKDSVEAATKAAAEISKAQVESARKTAEEVNGISGGAIREWTGMVMQANEFTRAAIMGTISTIGDGIADELVDGTHDWKKSLKQVLKQLISIAAQMLIIQGIYSALGRSSFGPLGVFMHQGGQVLHSGGEAKRYHSGSLLFRDEVPAVLQRGEYVINRRALMQPGALQSARAINSGQGAGKVTSQHFEGSRYSFQIHALDGADVERVVVDKIVPILSREERRGAYRQGS